MEWWLWLILIPPVFIVLATVGETLAQSHWANTTKEQRETEKRELKKRQAEEALQNLELEHKQWLDAKREVHRQEHREWLEEYFRRDTISTITVNELDKRPPDFQRFVIDQIEDGRAIFSEQTGLITFRETPL